MGLSQSCWLSVWTPQPYTLLCLLHAGEVSAGQQTEGLTSRTWQGLILDDDDSSHSRDSEHWLSTYYVVF